MINIAYNGKVYDFTTDQLDIGDMSSDQDILHALGNSTEFPGDYSAISNWIVRRGETGTTVFPQPIYG